MTAKNTKKLGRRDLLKVISAGAGGIVVSAFLPNKWTKPVVNFGVSPVHAQASAIPTATAAPTQIPLGTITGTIWDGVEGDATPIAGVVVTVDGTSLVSNTTGSDGVYTIMNVPLGPQAISCPPPQGLYAYIPYPSTGVPVTVDALVPVVQNFYFTLG